MPMYNGLMLGSPFLDSTARPARSVPYVDDDDWLNRNFGSNAPVAPTGRNPMLADAISGLLTPGLVPDIARQSAEVAAGRGVAGSPAADSTAVRMSEQNWLQRLGLANQLLSGEESRALPYQITPWQQALLASRAWASLGGSGGSGGGRGGYRGSLNPSIGALSVPPFAGTGFGSGPFGSDLSAAQMMGGPSGGMSWLGGGQLPETLDDIYASLGFGDMSVLGEENYQPSLPGKPDFGSLTPGLPDLDWDF